MKRIGLICILGLLLIASSAYAQIRLYTGQKDLTNYEIAKDLEPFYGSKISIVETEGSVENLELLKPGEVAITQFDVLQSQLLRSMTGHASNTDSLRILLPLGKTEIHIIARSTNNAIKTFRDLHGKKVAVGLPKQACYVTAQNLKELTNTEWQDVELSLPDAIAGLFSGEVDALIYVGASPVTQFSKFSLLPASQQKTLKLVSIVDNRLNDMYSSVKIPMGTYSWAENVDIPTYAVETILVCDKTGEGVVETTGYSTMVTTIKENLLKLQQNGKSGQWDKLVYNFKVLGEWKLHNVTRQIFFPAEASEDEK